MSRHDLNCQSKEIIFNVYNYLKDLLTYKPNERICDIFRKTQECAAEACKVSRWSVQKICAEACNTMDEGDTVCKFSQPNRGVLRVKTVTGIDDFDRDIIRRTVHEFYDRGEYPTCKKLCDILREKINFTGCQSSLRKILKSIGFKYKKCNDGRHFLLERKDITAARATFLRKMHNVRKEDIRRPIIYLDETWVNQNHSKKFIWQSLDDKCGLKVPIGKGSRLIICHAGSEKFGFINGSELIFEGKKGKSMSDYHQEMNSTIFKEWFINMLTSLEEGCIIVMDNASYHSKYKEGVPNSKSRKADVLLWLREKDIPHNPTSLLPELLSIVKQHRYKYQFYELDILASLMGHEVIRLPPYHCQYNPIELIWAQVKREVADKNKTFKMNNVRDLMTEALQNVTIEDWKKCVVHAERLQEEDYIKEGIRDENVQSIIINLRGEETAEDSTEDSTFSNEES